MADREEVIKGLEKVWDAFNHMEHELYADYVYDALELLKEQKGVPYVFNADGETVCGVCGCHFDKAYSNCPKCGKKVDWNA